MPSERLAKLRRTALAVLSQDAQVELRRRLGRSRPWDPGPRAEPPVCPPGLECAPPDFVGVGVQKGGTSWWLALLLGHPAVYSMPGLHKERHFFKNGWIDPFSSADCEAYARWFPRPAGKLSGEWTPDYMVQPWTLPLLKRAAPRAKILVLFRDPLDRFVSGLTHQRAHGHLLRPADLYAALERGRYADQVKKLFEYYPPDQVLLLQYERCMAATRDEFGKTCRFLGITDDHDPPVPERRVNATRIAKASVSEVLKERLLEEYTPQVRELKRLWPELDLGRWKHFSRLA